MQLWLFQASPIQVRLGEIVRTFGIRALAGSHVKETTTNGRFNAERKPFINHNLVQSALYILIQ